MTDVGPGSNLWQRKKKKDFKALTTSVDEVWLPVLMILAVYFPVIIFNFNHFCVLLKLYLHEMLIHRLIVTFNKKMLSR